MDNKKLDSVTKLRSTSPRRVIERSPFPTEIIEFKGMRFLIADTPHEITIRPYIEHLLRNNVKVLVGVCGVKHSLAPFHDANIEVKELRFAEGTLPDESLRRHWFRILIANKSENPDGCIAVYCNSGLGRAALLVAIALIELGMGYETAVNVIRSKRRGAITEAQFNFLKTYRAEAGMAEQKFVNCGMQ
ncbi:PRL-1 phosphatase-like [Eurosta solidaginis]|uniref:PRL-1 phosphatase-like n=1 Tax=Eurosta solidaginis TaxID=178769 RepID=UPI003530BD3B